MGGGVTTVVGKCGEILREQIWDDEGIYWTHLCGGCCGMETQIVCTESLLGEGVKWDAAAYATSLLRGCREE